MDVSDFVTVSAVVLTDTLGDGQTFHESFDPTFAVTENGVATNGTFALGSTYTVSAKDGAGRTTIVFDLSAALVQAGEDGDLAGDQAADGAIGQGPTRVTITFRSIIDAQFSGPVPGNPLIQAGDPIGNDLAVSARTPAGTALPSEGSSSTAVAVRPGGFEKTVFAFNGVSPPPASFLVGAGDTVTFRIRATLAPGQYEQSLLIDFLPSPLFDVTEITGTSSAIPPPPGSVAVGPDDTAIPLIPPTAFATDAAQNSISYGPIMPFILPTTEVLDLLFTVTATTEPFGDRLVFNNLAVGTATNSFLQPITVTDTEAVTTRAPQLTIRKDIVSSTNPGSGPGTVPAGFDDAFENADAGDQLTFAITLENQGSKEAIEVRLSDRWSQGGVAARGYSSCSVDSVEDGAGAALPFTGDLFTGELTLTNPLPADSDGTVEPNEQAVVTFTCTVDPAFTPGPPIDDEAVLTHYTTVPGAPNFATNALTLTRKARVSTVGIVDITKAITASSLPGTTPVNNINQGENLTFEITASLSEGVYPGFSLTDTATTIPPITCGSAGFTCSPNVSVNGTTVTVAATPEETPGTITYTYTQQKTAGGSNTASVSFTGASPVTASTTWTLDAPNPTLSKSLSPETAQGGDTITVGLTFGNSDADNPMFQCIVTDVLDPAAYDLATVVEGTTPAGWTFSYDQASGTVRYTASDPNAACPASSTATFTVQVRPDVRTGSTFVNQATLTGRTLPTNHPNEPAGGNVSASANRTLSIQGATSRGKRIAATSEDATDPGDANAAAVPPVAIGEVITYQIDFGLADGVTAAASLRDVLQAGLTFIPGSATLARNRDGITMAADPGGINGAAAGTAVPVTPVVTGTDITLDLGNITVTPDAVAAGIRLSFQAVVANVAANNAGVTLSNTGNFLFTPLNGVPVGVATNSVGVRVAEPVPRITKTVDPTAASGGDLVRFTLVIANDAAGGTAAPAFNWTYTDTLPANYLSPTVVLVTPLGTPVPTFTGNVLSGTIDRLDPGEAVTVVYTAQIDPSALFAEEVTNTASAETTSLPGANGTAGATPGAPGTATGERTATGGVNDLRTTDSATVIVSRPSLTKRVFPQRPFWAIGEHPTFELIVGVPRGSTERLVLRDVLPAGLGYVPGSLAATLPGGVTSTTGGPILTEATPGFFTAAGGTLTFDFGTVTAAGAGNIRIVYRTTVENVLTNQSGTLLRNSATLAFADPANPASNLTVGPIQPPEPIRVGEPNLEMGKVITAGATNSQAGDTVSWQIVIGNVGDTTAYQVDWRDVLPAGLFQISNARISTAAGDVFLNGTSTPVLSNSLHVSTTTSTNDTLDLASTAAGDAADTIQIAPGAAVTITFDSVLQNTVTPGQVLTNTTPATYTSLVSGGRSGADGGDDDVDTLLNNYTERATQSVTVASPISIEKSVPDSTRSVGDTVTYQIKVNLIQGTTPDLVFTDVLPAGLTYVSHTITTGNQGITVTNPNYNQRLGTGQTVSFDFGTVTNPANGNTTDDFGIVFLTVRVDNIAANQDGTVLSNGENADGSQVFVTFGAGPTRVDFDADGSTAGNQGRPLTVVEPALRISKTVRPTSTIGGTEVPIQGLGGVVTFSVTIEHDAASTADAFDLVVTDTLVSPTGTELTYVPGSASLPAADVTQNGNVLTFRIASLPRDAGSTTFTYQARIGENAPTLTPDALCNGAMLTWASIPGATGDPDSGRTGDGGVNDYTTDASACVLATAAAFVEAQKTVVDLNGGLLLPGDTLEYTVVLSDQLRDVDDVVFTDTVPATTTFVPGTLTTTRGTTDEAGAPTLEVAVGPLRIGETVTITFRVTVNAGVPDGTVISNQGSVDSSSTVPEPTDWDGVEANGDQPTDIVVGPTSPPASPLYVQKVVALADDLVPALGVVNAGDVMRYTLIFTNLGPTTLQNVVATDTVPAGLSTTLPPASAARLGPPSITGSGSTIDVTGQSLSIFIPSLAPSEFVVATFGVQVIDPLIDLNGSPSDETFTNQATASADGVSPVLSDVDGDPSDGNQPTSFVAIGPGGVAAPILDVQKRVDLVVDPAADGVVNPGDTLEYVVAIRNAGSAPSTNTRLADPIPANTTIVPGSVATSQGVVLSESPLDVNIGAILPGFTVTVRFQVTVDAGTPDGTILVNQATATAANVPAPVPSDDNGVPEDGLNPNLTPVGDPSGRLGDLAKGIIATSEPDTIAGSVLIGETVSFGITVRVPVGTTHEVAVVDTLPPGLIYLGPAFLTRTFDTALTASANPAGINAAPSGTPVQLVDGTDVVVNGQEVRVFLGDVINSDNDLNEERYVLSFMVQVANVAANQEGVALANSATVTYFNVNDQEQMLAPATRAVRVVEPNVQVAKTVDPLAVLTSGGTATYTITVTNPPGLTVAPAYDLRVVDMLGRSLVVTGVTPSGGVTGVTDNSTTSTVDVSVGVFPPGGQLVITYRAAVAALPPGTQVDNTASASWTSLPGPQGTGNLVPGAPGEPDGERTGDQTGPNDYTTSDLATVVVGDVALDKTIDPPQTRYAIGDPVQYRVEISVPALASLANGVVRDVLAAGLAYRPGSLAVTLPPGVTGTVPADFTVAADTPGPGQQTLELALGTLTNTVATPQTVVLTYRVAVANVLSNQDGQSLANEATFSFDDPGTGLPRERSDATTVTVGEPHLALTKIIVGPAAGLDAGNRVAFRVEVGNDGSTTSYDTVLMDVLPAGLENVSNLLVVAASGGAERPVATSNGTGWVTSPFDIPPGGAVTIVFDATLANTVVPGQQLQNEVAAEFTSRDGTDAGERDGADGSTQDDAAVLDNYNAAALAPVITVADPIALDKRFFPDAADTTATIGEEYAYRLTVSLIEGVVNDVVVTDTLPDGVEFLRATVGAGNLGITHQFTPPPAQAGQVLTFDLGDVQNPSDGIPSDDFIAIDVTVRVTNVTANQNGTVLPNNAELAFTGPTGAVTRPFDANAIIPGIQPLDLTVVEPDLAVTKRAVPLLPSLGGQVLYILEVSHTGQSGANAFDVVVSDTVPPGLTYVPGSAVPPAVLAGRTLTWTLPALTRTQGRTVFAYRAVVDLSAPVDVPITNTAQAGWSTLAGPSAEERTGVDGPGGLNDLVTSDSATVTPSTTAFIEAVKTVADLNGGQVLGGDTLEYTVLLRNERSLPVTDVAFTDPVPIGTTYVAGSLAATKGTPDDSDRTLLRVAVGPMLPSETVTITFRVTVDPSVVALQVISNQGSVDSDQTVPEPTDVDGIDSNGDQPTNVIVGGLIGPAALKGEKQVELAVDEDTSGDVTAGDSLRYTIVLTASGQTLTNVTLSDMIPAGLTAVPGSETIMGGTGGTVTITGSDLDATIAALAPGLPAVVTFLVTVDAPLIDLDGDPDTETFTNQGMIGAAEVTPGVTDGDPVAPGNQPTRITAVAVPGTGVAALDLQKTKLFLVDACADGVAQGGDVVEWSVVLRNVGSATAADVHLDDVLPANTTLVPGSVQPSEGALVSTDPISVNVGPVVPGHVVTLTFRSRVNAGTPEQAIISNQAEARIADLVVAQSDDDANPDNGHGATTITAGHEAELAIGKTASPSPAAVDGRMVYTLTVTNNGPTSPPASSPPIRCPRMSPSSSPRLPARVRRPSPVRSATSAPAPPRPSRSPCARSPPAARATWQP